MADWNLDLRARLAALHLTPAREAEIIEELSQHLDEHYTELCAGGADHDEARRLALAELGEHGGLARLMQSLRQAHAPVPIVHGQRYGGLLGGVWQDVRSAVRTTRTQPGFTVTVIVTLALGIAVNTTVFTIVNGAALRPLPFEHAERIVQLNVRNNVDAQSQDSELSYLEFQDWRAVRRTLDYIVGTEERPVDISGDNRPAARVAAAFVSWNTFAMLGQPPVAGRDFQEADDQAGAPPVVILGWSLWQARYGGDSTIVGQTIRVNGRPSTIIGVMPERFGFPYRVEFWLPLAALPEPVRTSRSERVLDGFGRLRPDATLEQATTELAGVAGALAERYPDTNRNIVPFVTPFGIAPMFVAVLVALLGAVGFVLLIACANVANLMLARAADRAREVTLRVALGASRWRVVRQLLVESFLLAGAGGAVGLALSHPAVQLFTSAAAEEAPSWVQFRVDGSVVGYLALMCVGSALVCSLVPAWHASRIDIAATLNDTARGSIGGRGRRRWMGAFVVAQVTLALVLLSGAMLMMQNLINVLRTDVGVETGELSQTALNLRQTDDTPERRRLFLAQLEERLAASPTVNAAVASAAPFGGAAVRRLRIDGQSGLRPEALPSVSLLHVGQRYFEVTGARILAGRGLTDDELRQPNDTAVVNERFAEMYFDGSAIGRRFTLIDPSARADGDVTLGMTIVGVVTNVRQRWLPSGEFDPVVYMPYVVDPPTTIEVLARSTTGPVAAASFVGDQVRALDPDLPVPPVLTVETAMARILWAQRLFGSMFTAFAAIALALATCGLYAVTAYAVSRRTREIGVRVALGAEGRGVWWAVARTTLWQLAIGLILGTAGAIGVATILPAILVGGGRPNPLTFAAMALVLLAAGVTASAIPARRAIRLDAVTALQAE